MNIFLALFSILFCCNVSSQITADVQVELIKSEDINADPPFSSCHASSIAELTKNKFIATWFAGTCEGCSDVGIWISINTNGIWTNPIQVVSSYINDSIKSPCWNPVLFKSSRGKLYLFYKQGKSPREWVGLVKTSDDDGTTWSESLKLPTGFLGPIKNKPIQLKSGEILCSSSTESMDEKKWRVHLEITNKALTSWEKVQIDSISQFGVIQPCIILHPGGKLQMLCRSRENCVMQTWSSDNGKSWNKLNCLDVPNPNSGIDAVTLLNGLHVMVYNPLQKGSEWFDGRNILSVAVSVDGFNWKESIVLENEKNGEFSYPAIIQSNDGLVHITYTSNRKRIKHVVLKIK